MKRNKTIVFLFSVLLVFVIAVFGVEELQWDGTVSLSVEITKNGNRENVYCWEMAEREYIMFLPSYADLSQAKFQTHTSNTVCIDGKVLTADTTCDSFELNVPYELAYDSPNGYHYFQITFLKSDNVPTVYIDTASGSMDSVHEEKGNKEPGIIRVYTEAGELNYGGNLESIQGRGNSTWTAPKKPYSITLPSDEDLLNMGAAKRWILLADYRDASLIRNKMIYDFAQKVGMQFSPECKWVDLYLNGEYAGLYLLSERNEIHSERVDLPQEDSFLVSREFAYRLKDQNRPFAFEKGGKAMRIHHASLEVSELEEIWQSVDNAILAEDGIDPTTGKSWTELIDVDSWVMRYLIDECFGNQDGGYISQFFYWSRENGKVYAGPIWDMDYTLGRGLSGYSASMLMASRPYFSSADEKPYFYALYQKEEFYNRTVDLYQTVFLPLLNELLDTEITRYTEQIAQAAVLNQVRWKLPDPVENIEFVRTYLEDRVAFLNDLWLEGGQYFTVQVNNGAENLTYFAVRPGESLPNIPTGGEMVEWINADTLEPYDITQPVYEDLRICLGVKEEYLEEFNRIHSIESAESEKPE